MYRKVLKLTVDSLTNFVAKSECHAMKRDALKIWINLSKRKLLVLFLPSRAVSATGMDRYAFRGLNLQGTERCATVLSNFKWPITYKVIMLCICGYPTVILWRWNQEMIVGWDASLLGRKRSKPNLYFWLEKGSSLKHWRSTHRRYSCIQVRVMERGYIGSVEWYTEARSSGDCTASSLEYSRAALKRETVKASALLVFNLHSVVS